MTAQEMRTIRAAAKQDISHRDRKDHKDLAVLNFSRSTSVFGNGDLNFRPRLMMAPGGEDDPRRDKEDISHRDHKDHKDLAVLNFSRSTSVFGNGDLNFRPRLMMALGGEDGPLRGKEDISPQRSQRFGGFKFQSSTSAFGDGGRLTVRSLSRRPIFFVGA
jgi:hypothetical protein